MIPRRRWLTKRLLSVLGYAVCLPNWTYCRSNPAPSLAGLRPRRRPPDAGRRRGCGRTAQAYLFSGPPAIGKRTLARAVAQRLVCLAPEATRRPCGHCRACRLVAADAWPDVHMLGAPLRIEAVRELQHDLALAPNESPHRVAIVPEVELATLGAANSLLKTLEEPPRQVVLLLTTADPGAVLPTIRSRCQVLPLRPLPVGEGGQRPGRRLVRRPRRGRAVGPSLRWPLGLGPPAHWPTRACWQRGRNGSAPWPAPSAPASPGAWPWPPSWRRPPSHCRPVCSLGLVVA